MASNPTWVASPDQLASVPRNTVHAMIEGLLQFLDDQDGDPDLEAVDEREEDETADPAWVERVNQTRAPYAGHRSYSLQAEEDAEDDDAAEDDDPGGGNVTDEPHDDDDEGTKGELSAWPEQISQATLYPDRIDGPWRGWSGASLHEDAEEDDAPEANGDERDSGNAEDEILFYCSGSGPGCPIADPGGCQFD
jgi:hypothetical protein